MRECWPITAVGRHWASLPSAADCSTCIDRSGLIDRPATRDGAMFTLQGGGSMCVTALCAKLLGVLLRIYQLRSFWHPGA